MESERELILEERILWGLLPIGNVTSVKIFETYVPSLIKNLSLLWLPISRYFILSAEIARSLFLEPNVTFRKSLVKNYFWYPQLRSRKNKLHCIFVKFLSIVLNRTYLRHSPRIKLLMVCSRWPLFAGMYLYLFSSFWNTDTSNFPSRKKLFPFKTSKSIKSTSFPYLNLSMVIVSLSCDLFHWWSTQN